MSNIYYWKIIFKKISSPYNQIKNPAIDKNGPNGINWPFLILFVINPEITNSPEIIKDNQIEIITPGKPIQKPIIPANLASPKPIAGFLKIISPNFIIKIIIKKPIKHEIKFSKILIKIFWLFNSEENIDAANPNKNPIIIIELGMQRNS